ncbi:Neutral alpha-glucosidase AB [Tritrichomonas foetus]|uniref:Glucosidase II subunit alpha n=1 Tax=Tritrichomonas foetus TaxID=1144522 RepID=A0A1J4J996_9EUKA|nr:Neutral alpha-glucosidase AB [Tritrichomonas foetus]|eukprot:OHS95762.1 Neutral alpha-glucosidase AB [Tritrichomonas foetus]
MFFVLFSLALSFEQSKYRTCSDSKFCQRNRNVNKQNWTINENSIKNSGNKFEALINDGRFRNDLKLTISFLSCGSARIRVEPTKKENFHRFDLSKEKTVINQNELNSLNEYTMKKTSKSVILTSNQNNFHSIEINFSPFFITLTDKSGTKRMTINADDTAIFETNRNIDSDPELFEHVTFDYQDDVIPNGPTAVSMNVDFHSNGVKLTGLPSHSFMSNELPLTQNSEPLRLFNTDTTKYDVNSTTSMHGSVPFIFGYSNSGFDAAYWNNPSDTLIDIYDNFNNNQNSQQKGSIGKSVRFISEGGLIDLFVFTSSQPAEISNSFTKITGRPQLVPEFALGFHQSRWGYYSDDVIEDVSHTLDEHLIPHDSIWLNVDSLDNRKILTFENDAFPSPSKLFGKFAQSKRYIIEYLMPQIKGNNDFPLFDEAEKNQFLVKHHLGATYFANGYPGKTAWIDFFNEKAQRWWESCISSQFLNIDHNVFINLDMNQPSVYEDYEMTFPRTLKVQTTLNNHQYEIEIREVHNLYGHLSAYSTFNGLLKRDSKNLKRPFILSKSFFAGTQKYAVVSQGDNQASWRHLAASLSMVLSYGIAGQVYNGADVGGYFDHKLDGQLLSRWYQVGAWTYPFFRSHTHRLSQSREILTLNDEQFDVAREAIVDRYKLLPYWYTLSRHSNLTGEPIIRPVWWEFPTSIESTETSDTVMLGSSLLISPFLDVNQTEKTLNLPPQSKWYNYQTLQEVQKLVQIDLNGGRTPVFIRGGSIIPTKNKIRRSSELMKKDSFSLTVAVDENGKASGDLYVDDGKTINFMKSEYIHKLFEFDGTKLSSSNFDQDGKNDNFSSDFETKIQQIRIVGLNKKPTKILDRKGNNINFTIQNGIVEIYEVDANLKNDLEITFLF